MSNSSAMSMPELELESAEMLPGRETLCVTSYHEGGELLGEFKDSGYRRPPSLVRRAQTVATCWVLCVIPLLLPALGYLLLRLPATNRALWLSISHSASQIVDGLAEQQYAAAAVSAIGAVLAALSIAGSLYITTGLARRAVATGRRWSAGRPDRGLVAVVAGAGSMAGLVAFWVAQGQFTGW
jgi:hypothetical protein